MKTKTAALFSPVTNATSGQRIDSFTEWAKPNGVAGINLHAEMYNESEPYFAWATTLLPTGERASKSWFLKIEFVQCGRQVFKRARHNCEPEIYDRDGLIPPSRFLSFAKALVNVLSYYRQRRSPASCTVLALTFLEKAIRDLHDGENSPEKLNGRTFQKALLLLEESHLHPGRKYDVGRELELIAGMMQAGYHSKSFRFAGRGFHLLEQPFAFTSHLKPSSRKREETLNSADLKEEPANRISGEDVAAVGLAYRKAQAQYGPGTVPTFMAATAGLALTTVSMRVSDALTLRRDAIYADETVSTRRRIRLARPKIGTSQDLPIAEKLGDLAQELFEEILGFTDSAHRALAFYVENYPNDFDSIDQLYIPPTLTALFKQSFLSLPDVYEVMGLSLPANIVNPLPPRLGKLEFFYHIDCPGDIWNPHNAPIFCTATYVTIADLERFCLLEQSTTTVPADVDRKLYITRSVAEQYVRGKRAWPLTISLRKAFASGRKPKKTVRTDDLKSWLLNDFKGRMFFPHWPFLSKERVTRIDQALFVWHQVDQNSRADRGENIGLWWLPRLVTPPIISSLRNWVFFERMEPIQR